MTGAIKNRGNLCARANFVILRSKAAWQSLLFVIARRVAPWQSSRRFRFLERQSSGKAVWIAGSRRPEKGGISNQKLVVR
jgi:hypothetical protein